MSAKIVVARDNQGIHAFVRLVMSSLAAAGVDCVQIGPWERHSCEPYMDVDIAVSITSWSTADSVVSSLRTNEIRCLREFRSGALQSRWDFLVYDATTVTVIGVDLATGVVAGKLPAIWYDDVWDAADRLGIDGRRSEITAGVYHAVKSLARGDLEGYQHQVTEEVGDILTEAGVPLPQVRAGTVGRGFGGPDGDGPSRRAMAAAAFGRRPLRFVRDVFAASTRILSRALKPDGAGVVVLGPDGSGKSSVCIRSSELLRHGFRSVTSVHIGMSVIHRTGEQTSEPHAQPAYGHTVSLLKLAFLWLNYGYGWLLKTLPDLIRGACVLHDRGMLDIVADPQRYRLRSSGPFTRLVARCSQRPLMVVILDVSPALVVERKGEIGLLHAEELRRRYLALDTGNALRLVVDGARPVEEIANAVALRTFEAVADRSDRRRT